MKKLGKMFLLIFKIILILLLVCCFNLLMMPKYIEENQDGRILAEMYREKISSDIIFIGSSTVYSGVVPATLYSNIGTTSYICASSSQTAWDSVCVLKEALKYNNPKLIVMDIGFLTTEDDYSEEVSNRKLFDYMRYSVNRHLGIKDAMNENESIWSYYLPILRYHERYKDLSLADLKYLLYKPNVTYNGYIMNASIDGNEEARITIADKEDIKMSDRNYKCLQEIISICNENDIALMFMKTPSYHAKWGTTYEAEINRIADEFGIKYVDFDFYSDDMGLDWKNDTPDGGGHLNLIGAEKFTRFLSYYLSENYDLPDRRENQEYSDIWDEKVKKYQEDAIAKIGL